MDSRWAALRERGQGYGYYTVNTGYTGYMGDTCYTGNTNYMGYTDYIGPSGSLCSGSLGIRLKVGLYGLRIRTVLDPPVPQVGVIQVIQVKGDHGGKLTENKRISS